MKKLLALIPFLSILLMAQTCNNETKQGVTGQVSWIEGNQMPHIGSGDDRQPAKPVKRTLRFYEPTTTDQVQQSGGFYSDPTTKLVSTVSSDENGNYTVALEPGLYSVFVEEENGLWANMFDGEGRINTVEVYTDSLTQHNILINYMAAY